MQRPVALITGASKRIGRAIAEHLHTQGFAIIIHYLHSEDDAQHLADKLNRLENNSACAIRCDLQRSEHVIEFSAQALSKWGRLDLLVNNASIFETDQLSNPQDQSAQFHEIFNTNVLANTLLSTCLKNALKETKGNIINLIDIYAERPLSQHTIYSTSKAACEMLTKSLANELAPEIRVNGISPGAILWPDNDMPSEQKQKIMAKIPLQRLGSTQAIVDAVSFLLACDYITGQVIAIDGGRSITI